MENCWWFSPSHILYQLCLRGWFSRTNTDDVYFQKMRRCVAEDSWLAFSQPKNIFYEVFLVKLELIIISLKRKYLNSFSSFFSKIILAEISKQMFWNLLLFSVTFFFFFLSFDLWENNFYVGSLACFLGFCWCEFLPSARKDVGFCTKKKLLPSENRNISYRTYTWFHMDFTRINIFLTK